MKENNNNKDKLNFLIKNIFISSIDSSPINIIKLNKNIDSFNFKEINTTINKALITKISNYKSITLFNKTHSTDLFFKFLYRFNKLIYFCYRKNIYQMPTRLKITISRDSGWGCMIRCGQMIMSRAIYKYLKSEKFTIEKAISETIKLFLDIPFDLNNIPNYYTSIMTKNPYINNETKLLPPFSIQMHCHLGNLYNKFAGEWFSDVNICQNYRDLNDNLNIFPNLKIFSFVSEFNLPEVLEKCFKVINNIDNNENNNDIITINNKSYFFEKSGLIFISMRLGINKITFEYYSSIKQLFKCKECIGIIGGETNLAHYFIGYNDKGNLIYLDPHITRECVNELNKENIINDYLTKNILEISMNDMSTALSVGFLFRNKNEFEDLIQFVEIFCSNSFPCFGFTKEKVEMDINKYENLFNDEDDF